MLIYFLYSKKVYRDKYRFDALCDMNVNEEIQF